MSLRALHLPTIAMSLVCFCLATSIGHAQCCMVRADVDHSGGIPDISDIVCLVDYVFRDGAAPVCQEEADVNFDGSSGDISDIVSLVDYVLLDGDGFADLWMAVSVGGNSGTFGYPWGQMGVQYRVCTVGPVVCCGSP